MNDEIIREDIEEIENTVEGNYFEGKTVLVTGGAGFLGSWICDVLVKLNAHIICVDNFSSGQKDNISHLLRLNNFTLVEHDISQPTLFTRKIDVVMHLASRASPLEFNRYPIQVLKANTFGTWIVLEIAKQNKARLIYTSTSEVYGDPDSQWVPTPETYNGNVNSVGPRSCYDESKRAGEAFVTAYKIQYGLDCRIVRLFNTYGPRMRSGDIYGRVVPRFIEQAIKGNPITIFGDGTQTRSFIYVNDLIDGILKATYLSTASGEVINLGNDNETQIIDLAKTILDLTESSSEIKYYPLPTDDPKRRRPDISKAKKLLRWEPKTNLQRGLIRTIKWFKNKG